MVKVTSVFSGNWKLSLFPGLLSSHTSEQINKHRTARGTIHSFKNKFGMLELVKNINRPTLDVNISVVKCFEKLPLKPNAPTDRQILFVVNKLGSTQEIRNLANVRHKILVWRS